MPTTAHNIIGPRIVANIDALSAEDFETASIRSAAPSYVSEAPSYHSTVPNSEPIPAYSPRDPAVPTLAVTEHHRAPGPAPHSSHTSLLLAAADPSASTVHPTTTRIGLPPLPPAGHRATTDLPELLAFRIPPWSMTANNPAVRHYQNVARRRVTSAAAAAAAEASSSFSAPRRGSVLDSVSESPEAERPRPLEDPYLVGEEAARKAKAERLARENGDAILQMEDRRWDIFLLQMKDWDDRERSVARTRRETETRGRRARRFALR